MGHDNLGYINRNAGIPPTDALGQYAQTKYISRSYHYVDFTPNDTVTGLLTPDELGSLITTGNDVGDQRAGSSLYAAETGQYVQLDIGTTLERGAPAATYNLIVPSTTLLGLNFRCFLVNHVVGGATAIVIVPDTGVTVRNNGANLTIYNSVELFCLGTNEYTLRPAPA